MKPHQRFFSLLKLDRKDITYVYIYAIISGLITLSLPLGVQAIIGLIAGGSLSASLFVLVAIVTVGTAFAGILKVMQLSVMETIQRRVFARSAFDFSYRLPRMKLNSLANYYPPELVNRFFDTVTLQKGLPKIIVELSAAALQILFGLVLIAFYHPFFVFFGAFLLVLFYLIVRYTGPQGLRTSLKESDYKYEVAYWLEEQARAVNTFKLAGNDTMALNKTDNLVSNYLFARSKHFRILLMQYGSIVAFKTIITASLLLLGGYLVIENQINIGQFVAAEIVIILVIAAVEKLIINMDVVYDVLTSVEKLGKVTDIPLEKEGDMTFTDLQENEGLSISLRNLHFQFPDARSPTLRGLDLEVRSGEKVVIAGYNRSGRATLMRVISGLLTDFSGQLCFNGFPVNNLNLGSLRKYIGDYSVYEDIFKGSILENITLGHPSVSIEEVISAAQELGLHEFIASLPDAYHTELLPEGRNIPHHMRTRLMLARSILANPLLLTVEGFFSGMEKGDRELVINSLTAPNRTWTMLAISDDPLLAQRCDRIIIMQDGNIIASGSYEELKDQHHFKAVFKL
ncbi:peptidase domain-containing ABC transporter [Flavilitoribacter nigricans]|uniref:Xenobiotic-transporting ATPase n=1 Tax=Flavilitoribacter nigricans (strain ATCC 23147 / DSM 23189 / NBRC 102662 / NCIMB 1420 / SS-2) TaxID=1122177 RepID=A0A2D0N431_FLAN2|nr:ABC transporter transmembrane domain-containing protein [Flavilitoribacter nigricans]PHN03148.1 xenobiotic-transporting ATPase [Flavilitoribacter nigricans DSM 23189 = NBRC 102662]